jgi:SAM-dependent methyltransferase
MLKEYLSIRPFLPRRCSNILDIGCGVGGISYFLHKHYNTEGVHLYLLDKSQIERNVYYMFNEKGAFYNSLLVAKAMLIGSGIQENFVHLVEATDNNDINITCKIDLAISLISWGFHYPIETYLDRVLELLNNSGIVILDIRKNTGQITKLEKTFSKTSVAKETDKFWRVACWK